MQIKTAVWLAKIVKFSKAMLKKFTESIRPFGRQIETLLPIVS